MHGLTALRARSLVAIHSPPAAFVIPAAEVLAAPAPDNDMSSVLGGALGCAVAGVLVAGGLVPLVNRAMLYVGLVGVVLGSFCAIARSLTPIVTQHASPPRRLPPASDMRHAAAEATIPHLVAFRAGVLGTAVATGTRR